MTAATAAKRRQKTLEENLTDAGLLTDEQQAKALDQFCKFVGSIGDPTLDGHCNSDVFGNGYIGYWAYGVQSDSKLGWLIYEQGDDTDPQHTKAIAAWRAGKELPERYFRIDAPSAVRAYHYGVRRWGENWDQEKGDANTYDWALQLALLGEVRYAHKLERSPHDDRHHRGPRRGQYRASPRCDGCDRPVGTNHFTDDEVCAGTDGPGFYLCDRKACVAALQGLDVEERRAVYTETRIGRKVRAL